MTMENFLWDGTVLYSLDEVIRFNSLVAISGPPRRIYAVEYRWDQYRRKVLWEQLFCAGRPSRNQWQKLRGVPMRD